MVVTGSISGSAPQKSDNVSGKYRLGKTYTPFPSEATFLRRVSLVASLCAGVRRYLSTSSCLALAQNRSTADGDFSDGSHPGSTSAASPVSVALWSAVSVDRRGWGLGSWAVALVVPKGPARFVRAANRGCPKSFKDRAYGAHWAFRLRQNHRLFTNITIIDSAGLEARAP